MAKRGGFPGGGMGMPGNMNNLMKQAQKMQRQMEESQKELAEKEYTAAAGGGAVEVTVSGKKEITKVKLDPDKHIDTKETIKYSRVGIKVKIRRKINMAKRGGFPGMGMPGNMNNLMKQAQKMQRQMEESQKELAEKEYTAAAGGGAVEVTVSGKKEITKVKLDPEAVDPDDVEMLEDLIMAAVNQALRQQEEDSAATMSRLTGGFGGGFPF